MIHQIHELHCGSFCPIHSSLYFPTQNLTCRCLLIETDKGLILCDTGLPSLKNLSNLAQLKLKVMQAKVEPFEQCTEKIKNLGFNPQDIRHIILTHLDIDHAGAISEFPWAEIHLHQQESTYFNHISLNYKFRYFKELLPHGLKVKTYNVFGEKWNDFEAVQPITGLKDEILLVPLLGHSKGHSGIAIKTKTQWILHSGDAFYFQEDLNKTLHSRNLASETLQTTTAFNNETRIKTLTQLQLLQTNTNNIKITNSHDPRLGI